jgi:lambda family phage tail tape measure protein
MAKDLKAQLEITADASGVEAGVGKAKKSLASLGATATTEGKKAAAGIEAIGAGGDAAATRVDRSAKGLINSIQRTTAAFESGGRGSAKYFELLATQRGVDTGVLKPYLDQLRAVESSQAAANAALNKGGIEFNKYGVSVKQNAAALRQVPAQLTDIIVGLQGGQAPLTVLLQQGGQLRDVFGGAVPAVKALGGAVLGLVNPYTLAASAVAALGFAYFQGSKEADALAKSIILSGNAAGVTVGQLTEMAQRLDSVIGTQASASAALSEFAANGNIASANIERFTLTAIRMEKSTGQAVKETVKQFAELGKSPVEASIKLNETTNFLTTSLYQQIRALDEQGRTAEAAAVAQKGYADALDGRLNQVEGRLGSIERGWRAVVGAAKDAWDAMLNVGRADTLQDQLQSAQADLEARLTRGPLNNAPGMAASFEKGNAALRERIEAMKETLRLEDSAAARQAESARQTRARIDFDKDGVQFLEKREKLEKAIAEARAKGAAAGASQVEIEKRVAAIQASFADKGAAKTALQIDKAELTQDLAAIKSASEQMIGTYAGSERILESIRSAGLLGDREYYEAKRAFINLETEAKESALKQEIDRLGKEKLAGKEKIDNDRKIAEATAKLLMVRADASSQLAVLANQEAAAQTRVALAYLTARQAAEDYLATQERQQDRMLAGIGQGNQQRQRDSGINQIEDRYATQRRDLDNQRAQLEFEGKFTEEARDQYAQRLAIINEFQTKSIASFIGYYDRLTATQGNWALGAQEALRNYADESANVFSQVGELVSRSFRGMEDALVGFVKTGKLDFRSLADSIISDLARIAAKKLIAGVVGNLFGGGGANLGTATGADMDAFYSFAGGGYTGSGSRSGGVDGKGGFPAILHPQETVVDHSAGQGMGGVTLNIINQTGTQVQGSVQQRGTAPDGSQLLDLVLIAVGDALANRTGPVARGYEAGYGPGM